MSGNICLAKPPTQNAVQSCLPRDFVPLGRCFLPGRFLGAPLLGPFVVGKKRVGALEGVHRTAPAFFLPLFSPANSQLGKGLADSAPPP